MVSKIGEPALESSRLSTAAVRDRSSLCKSKGSGYVHAHRPHFGPIGALRKNALWQSLTTALPERSEISTIGRRQFCERRARHGTQRTRAAFHVSTRAKEISMSGSPKYSRSQLPRRLPVGATYVVEGFGGAEGDLRVIARYVVLPGGRRINIPADLSDAAARRPSSTSSMRRRAPARPRHSREKRAGS